MLKFFKGYGLGYAQCILKGAESFKSPMLVVGANSKIRELIPAETLKLYDVHLLFFPTAEATWQLGILYVSRAEYNLVALNLGVGEATELALEQCIKAPIDSIELHPKAMQWLVNSIYRCPKLSIKDLLALEPYVKKTA